MIRTPFRRLRARAAPWLAMAVGVGAVAAGCAEPSTAPFPVPASLYVAESANGVALPVQFPNDGATRAFLDYLSVSFERDGTAVRVQTFRVIDDLTRVSNSYTSQMRFDVRVRGDTITLVPRCPPNALALCIGPEQLLRSGENLTVNLGLPISTIVTLVPR